MIPFLPRVALASLVGGWLLFGVMSATGHLIGSNRLLSVPPILFMAGILGALGSIPESDRRAPLVAIAVASFVSILVYALIYVFIFAFGPI